MFILNVQPHRLYFAEKPFTRAILKSLRFSMEYEIEMRRLEDQRQLKKGHKQVGSLCIALI